VYIDNMLVMAACLFGIQLPPTGRGRVPHIIISYNRYNTWAAAVQQRTNFYSAHAFQPIYIGTSCQYPLRGSIKKWMSIKNNIADLYNHYYLYIYVCVYVCVCVCVHAHNIYVLVTIYILNIIHEYAISAINESHLWK